MIADGLPDEAYAAALAALPLVTPARLRRLLSGRTARAAWHDVLDLSAEALGCRRLPLRGSAETASAWRSAALSVDVGALWSRYTRSRVRVHVLGRAGYPPALASDRRAPPILFCSGDDAALDVPRVALVGTRSATHYGQDVAAELGLELAGAGVAVVSGLAQGIDRSAHEGALARDGASPVGVVASGIDVPYPKANAMLWERVRDRGLLMGEAPIGSAPQAWRFPTRNGVIAAVCNVVVVVESHRRGGALVTADAALERSVEVMAVPGSVRSPASAGTNALIAEGAKPVLCAEDVLTALSLMGERVGTARGRGSAAESPTDAESPAESPTGLASSAVLEAVGWEPTPTATVVRLSGLDLGTVALVLDSFEREGRVRHGSGWWERVDRMSARRP